jgi:diacylglycerol kinase (ATP)
MTKYQVIVNPIAGRGTGGRSIPLIEQTLRGYGLDFSLVRTERPWHAAELAQQAARDGYDVVVAAGGDGTANEVLNGLMLAKQEGKGGVAMNVISVGRGNDLAFGMVMPKGVEEGCKVLAEGHRRLVDVGKLSTPSYGEPLYPGVHAYGRYFGNGVGIGFDAVVGFEALKLKWLTGFPSYIVAVLKTVFLYYRAPLLRIEHDAGTITQPCLMVSTMNGRRFGGGFMMAPQGEPDDGWFDCCIVRQVSRLRCFGIIPHFMKGTQATQPEVTMVQSRRFVMTAEQGTIPAHIDGETVCTEGKQLTLELLPKQIEVICSPVGTTV